MDAIIAVLNDELRQRQSLPLKEKEQLSIDRIKGWYSHWNGNVYVSFSGGKDSTVLLSLVRRYFPEVPAVFVSTGLEFPEIVSFVKSTENVICLRPKITFSEVIKKYGYPVLSKEHSHSIYQIRNTKSEKLRNLKLYGDEKGRWKLPEKWKYLIDADILISDRCCHHLKIKPILDYEKKTNRKPFIGTMAADSYRRKIQYLKNGCNLINVKNPKSTPLGFWTEKDIWEYIKSYKIPYSPIYDMGYRRTGCIFCMYGIPMRKGENRFALMKTTHPALYNYCMVKLGCAKVLDILKIDH